MGDLGEGMDVTGGEAVVRLQVRLPDHWRARSQGADEAAYTVTQDTTLNPRVELGALDINIANLSGGEDVRHAGHGLADKHDEQWQYQSTVD
jgi:hypothetical protein